MISEVPGPGTRRKTRTKKRLSPAAVIARSLGPDAAGLSPADIIARSVENAFGSFPAPPPPQPREPRRPQPEPPASEPFDTFWAVWIEHQDYLFKQSLRFMSGNAADAEDALSQAMLKASQHFNAAEIRNERAWLTRLVHNACMDQHRARRRQQRLAEEILPDDAEEVPTLQPQAPCAPDEALQLSQLFETLESHLRQLPVTLLEPLMLRVIEDKSYTEIAERMGLSNCAVRKRIQLARDHLRKAKLR